MMQASKYIPSITTKVRPIFVQKTSRPVLDQVENQWLHRCLEKPVNLKENSKFYILGILPHSPLSLSHIERVIKDVQPDQIAVWHSPGTLAKYHHLLKPIYALNSGKCWQDPAQLKKEFRSNMENLEKEFSALDLFPTMALGLPLYPELPLIEHYGYALENVLPLKTDKEVEKGPVRGALFRLGMSLDSAFSEIFQRKLMAAKIEQDPRIRSISHPFRPRQSTSPLYDILDQRCMIYSVDEQQKINQLTQMWQRHLYFRQIKSLVNDAALIWKTASQQSDTLNIPFRTTLAIVPRPVSLYLSKNIRP